MVNIEENRVLLVQSMTSYYDRWFIVSISLILVVILGYTLLTYIEVCNIKRRKLKILSVLHCVEMYRGWNIFRLKKEIQKLESLHATM